MSDIFAARLSAAPQTPMALKVLVALGALVVLASAGHYASGEMQTQATEQPQSQYRSALHEDESVHQKDLDNRADMLGVEQDFFRGGPTNFTDPGYRDLPNPAQMQLANPAKPTTAPPTAIIPKT